jgi:hypothetical protein
MTGQRNSEYRGSAAVSFFIPPKMATIRGEPVPEIWRTLTKLSKQNQESDK